MVVATAYSMAEAAIIAGRLQSLGIPAFVRRESVGLLIFGDGPGAQAKVLVPEKYYEMSIATLEPDEDILLLGDGEDEEYYEDDENDEWDAD